MYLDSGVHSLHAGPADEDDEAQFTMVANMTPEDFSCEVGDHLT